MAAWLILLPLIGAGVVAVAPARQARWIALAVTSLTLLYSALLAAFFDHWNDGGFGLTASVAWLEKFGVTLSLGADTVSLLLVLLTTLIMPLCVAGSFKAVGDRVREYYGWLLAIEAAMIGVFLARDLILFYICFEFTLLPMYFLIAIWGSANRERASITFFLYTFTGSLITLAGLLYVAWQNSVLSGGEWTFDIARLTSFSATHLSAGEQAWVLLALMAGFAVKVPLFPLHTWLPLAHTEAPTAGSVILAAVLLKLGTYGLYRFVLPMTPSGLLTHVSFNVLGIPWFHVEFMPLRLIAVLAIIGILYAALVCWVQSDVKRLVAYSSVSHLGFCVLGLVALNPLGAQGSVLYMINHGLSTGALFFMVGMMYERYHTRDMDEVGGLSKRMPVWAFFMVFFVLSSVGLPGLNGFVSEFLCLIGAFTAHAGNVAYPGVLGPWYAAIAAVGMIFAAMYLLIMVGKIVFGPLREPGGGQGHDAHGAARHADLTWREIAVLAPLAILCLYLGFQSKPLTDAMSGSISQTLAAYPALVSEHYRAQAEATDPAPQGDFTAEIAESAEEDKTSAGCLAPAGSEPNRSTSILSPGAWVGPPSLFLPSALSAISAVNFDVSDPPAPPVLAEPDHG